MSQSTGVAWKDRLYMQSSSEIPEVRENAKAILAELGRLEREAARSIQSESGERKRCQWCFPSYGCWNGEGPCRKPDPDSSTDKHDEAVKLADKIEAKGLCVLCDYGENHYGQGERQVVPFPPDADRELIVKALRALAPSHVGESSAELALRISEDADFRKFVAMGKTKTAAMQAASLASSAIAPVGWKLVPEKLTPDMIFSLKASVRLYGMSDDRERSIRNLWSDVLNIAPVAKGDSA